MQNLFNLKLNLKNLFQQSSANDQSFRYMANNTNRNYCSKNNDKIANLFIPDAHSNEINNLKSKLYYFNNQITPEIKNNTHEIKDELIYALKDICKKGQYLLLDGFKFNEGCTDYFATKYSDKAFEKASNDYFRLVQKIKNFIDKLPVNLQKSFERALVDSKILDTKLGGGYPLLTRWFAINLNLRISPLTFIDLDLDRADIQVRLDEINNQK